MSQDEVEWHGGVVMRRRGLPWCQKLVVTRLLSCQCKPEQEERTTENHQMYQQGEQELERTEIVLGSHLLIVMKHTLIIHCPDTDCWPAGHWTTSLLIF